jgi:hypothetical protein
MIRHTALFTGYELKKSFSNPIWPLFGILQPVLYLVMFAPLLKTMTERDVLAVLLVELRDLVPLGVLHDRDLGRRRLHEVGRLQPDLVGRRHEAETRAPDGRDRDRGHQHARRRARGAELYDPRPPT